MPPVLPAISNDEEFGRFLQDRVSVRTVLAGFEREFGLGEPFERFARGSVLVAAAGSVVIKLFPPHEQALARTEALALQTLADRLPIPTPTPLAVGCRDGWRFILMERLDGQELKEVWPSLSKGEQMRLGAQLGAALAELHRLCPPAEVPAVDWGSYVAERRAQATTRQRALGCPPGLVAEIDDFLARADLSVGPRGTGWVHTEVMLEHLLVVHREDGWSLSGLFDFEPSWVAPIDYELPSIGLFVAQGDPQVLGSVVSALGIEPSSVCPERVLALALVHRYANLRWYIERLNGPADGLSALARAWFTAAANACS